MWLRCLIMNSREVDQVDDQKTRRWNCLNNRWEVNRPGNVRVTWQWRTFVPPLLQWKSNEYYIFWVCVCSPSYPGCNAHAPYCHLWPDELYNDFPHYSIHGTTFGGKSYWTQNVCFDFRYNFCLIQFSFWLELSEIRSKVFVGYLITPTHAHIYYLRSLKFTLKHLKLSYMFRSHDHPQGAYFVPC